MTASLGRGHVTVGQGVLPQLQSLQVLLPEAPALSYPPEDHLVMNLNSLETCPFPQEKHTIFLECRDLSQIKLPLNHLETTWLVSPSPTYKPKRPERTANGSIPAGQAVTESDRLGGLWTWEIPDWLHWRRKWQPTPVFVPRESQGQGSLVGCHLRGRTESDTTEAT